MPVVLLDSGPLGILANPNNSSNPVRCRAWVASLINKDIAVVVPEIIAYELRRELIRRGRTSSLESLNHFRKTLPFLPTSKDVLEKAAELWATARARNESTAHDASIDIDVILSAHAILLAGQDGDYTVVATTNVRHIQRYTPADQWENITAENCFNPSLATSQRTRIFTPGLSPVVQASLAAGASPGDATEGLL